MHLARQIVLPLPPPDILVLWVTKVSRYSLTLRLLFGLAVILVAVSCSEEDPTGVTAGERMTVAEQVAIGSALEKAALALDSTHRVADTVLADLIRVGAGLVSRQGQHGRLSVRVQPRGGAATTLDMRGVAVRVNTGSARTHLVLVWEGLDVAQLRARRVLMLLFSGTVEEGTLPGAGGTIEGRWIDFTSGAAFPDPYLTTSGTATVNEGAFGGSCPGVTDTEDFSCTTGRQAILADAVVERSGEVIDIDWDAVVLPSFRIVGSLLGP